MARLTSILSFESFIHYRVVRWCSVFHQWIECWITRLGIFHHKWRERAESVERLCHSHRHKPSRSFVFFTNAKIPYNFTSKCDETTTTTKKNREKNERRADRENGREWNAILLTSFATNYYIHVKWVNIIFNRTLHLATPHSLGAAATRRETKKINNVYAVARIFVRGRLM